MSAIAAEPPIDLSGLWRSVRYPTILVLIGLALVTVLAAIGKSSNSTPLDPRNAAPEGARALATLLADRGVTVTVATSLPQVGSASGSTILLTDPGALSGHALATVARSASTVVLIDPPPSALSVLGVDAAADAQTSATLRPGCPLPAAVTAGSVQVDGDLYAVHGGVTGCYHQGADAALVTSTRANGATTIVLGSPFTLSNSALAKQGDAALALGLLDTATVDWVPGGLNAGPVPKSERGLFNLLPSRLLWATLQLFIALVVLALWRARRLGRPVVEPLPVVVRAAETVEGQGRLLHAAQARSRAAGSLRAATVRRLTHALRLRPDEEPASVVGLVAERAHAAPTDVQALLYGDVPGDDAALVRLAQALPKLEADVTGDEGPSSGGQQ